MSDEATCGAGLAQHAPVPLRIAAYIAELAETLDLHRTMLVLTDPASKRKDDVYAELATSYRQIAARLKDTASRMAAQRELPMGAHDEGKWTDAHVEAFTRFVQAQSALASLLREAAARDEEMLASMTETPS
jgi:hypothetical protein